MADKFLSIVISQHELLEYITNNYDPCFYGQFWDELVSLLYTTFILNIALYAQTDGIAEVMNHTME